MHAIQQQFWAVRDYLSPVLRESKFKEHGRITPEEFVAAGDFLTYKFPVWQWEKGDPSKAREFLPADKQYLVTRGVPCLRRAQSLAYTDADEDAERLLSFGDSSTPDKGEDEWVETHAGRKVGMDAMTNAHEIQDIPDLDADTDAAAGTASSVTRGMAGLSLGAQQGSGKAEASDVPPDLDDIPDMDDSLEEVEDAAAAAPKPTAPTSAGALDASGVEPAKGNLLQVRTYDVMITYDKYYQTPRIWLIGYDENRAPLNPSQIFQDISADHAQKTVTIEGFPHSISLQAASVHPCKHASVMKKVIERMNAGIEEQIAAQRKPSSKDSKKKWAFLRKSGGGTPKEETPPNEDENTVEGMRVDFYLVVFLKFIASIVPTIEVDSTTSF